jgi:AraC-like DNA-binding protein
VASCHTMVVTLSRMSADIALELRTYYRPTRSRCRDLRAPRRILEDHHLWAIAFPIDHMAEHIISTEGCDTLRYPPFTIPIVFVRGILIGARARGRSCESFLKEAGIAEDLLPKVGARVTTGQYVALFRLLIERLEDETLGLLSRPLKRGSFALVARSAIGAATLEVAMRRVARTFGLLQSDVELELVRDGALAGLALRFADPSIARPAFLHEMLLRVFWRLLAWLAGGQLAPALFDFAFVRPAYSGSYGKIFPAPLQFERQQSGFWFDARRLHDAVLRDEVSLRTFIEDAPANVIVPRAAGVFTARVRAHLQQMQPSWPDLGDSAAALHVSTATLQRRLAREGTSFQSLKDELRRDIAIGRLSTSTVTLAVLAFELGFADAATFQRAFKSWTGNAPGAYRRGRAHHGRR